MVGSFDKALEREMEAEYLQWREVRAEYARAMAAHIKLRNMEKAAPEMLEALEQALVHIEADERTHGRPFGVGNVVRAAISKAKGKTEE